MHPRLRLIWLEKCIMPESDKACRKVLKAFLDAKSLRKLIVEPSRSLDCEDYDWLARKAHRRRECLLEEVHIDRQTLVVEKYRRARDLYVSAAIVILTSFFLRNDGEGLFQLPLEIIYKILVDHFPSRSINRDPCDLAIIVNLLTKHIVSIDQHIRQGHSISVVEENAHEHKLSLIVRSRCGKQRLLF